MKRATLTLLFCMIAMLGMCKYITLNGITYETISSSEVAIAYIEKETISKDVILPRFVSIDGRKYQVKSIDGFSFSDIKSIIIPEGVVSIEEDAFNGCEELLSVKLPKSIKSIGDDAFADCINLTDIVIPQSVTSIGRRAFAGCSSLTTINVPELIKSIEEFTFYECNRLSSITIEEGVEVIKRGAFQDCKTLENLVIPNSVSHIEEVVFWGCENLKCITVPDNAKIDFENGNHAFLSCNNLEKVFGYKENYPKWIVEHLADAKFMPIKKWIEEAQESLANQGEIFVPTSPHDGIMYTPISSTEAEVHLVQNKGIHTLKIPEKIRIDNREYRVTAFRDYVFSNCKNLASASIPKSITSMGDGTFSNCTSLKSVSMSEGVTSIGSVAFYGCNNLISINIPESVVSIGDNAFSGCVSLNSIVIPNGITKIGKRTFFNCHAITSISIPKSVTSIGDYAFANCKSLKDIAIPEGLKTIESGTFLGCESLKEIIIPNSVSHIKEMAFANCTALESVVIPDNATMDLYKNGALGNQNHVFSGCKNLSTIHGHTISYPKWAIDVLQKDSINTSIRKWTNMAIAELNGKPIQTNNNEKQQKTHITQVTDNSIDKNIPIVTADNSRTFAIIIGNEYYKEVENVPHALNDARIFAVYCEKTLGVPSKNIKVYEDATFGTILSAIEYLQQVAKAFQGNINVIFYYAGHGVPNETTNEAYLLPVDANGRNTAACYQINKLYSELKGLNANQVTVFLDACFSGAQRGNGMLASSRGIAFNTKQAAPQGNMVVFSAASADETAYPFNEKGHGLFTYYLLKKLNETKGNVTLGELGKYICEKVAQESIVTNGKSQTPTVVSSANIATNWMEMKLIK